MNPTILTSTGLYFDLRSPEHSEFRLIDIAHALAHTCRFAGHCSTFYSVAQHSVHVSELVPHEHKWSALLHDAAEAYIGDVSAPLKSLLPDYRKIERNIEAHLFADLGVQIPMPACVKRADLVMLATEQRDLMPWHDDEWPIIKNIAPRAKPIEPWPPELARTEFIRRVLLLRDVDLHRGFS